MQMGSRSQKLLDVFCCTAVPARKLTNHPPASSNGMITNIMPAISRPCERASRWVASCHLATSSGVRWVHMFVMTTKLLRNRSSVVLFFVLVLLREAFVVQPRVAALPLHVLWSAVTCHRFPQATCRRRRVTAPPLARSRPGWRQPDAPLGQQAVTQLDGDKSPAESGENSPHSKVARRPRGIRWQARFAPSCASWWPNFEL